MSKVDDVLSELDTELASSKWHGDGPVEEGSIRLIPITAILYSRLEYIAEMIKEWHEEHDAEAYLETINMVQRLLAAIESKNV